MVMGVPDPTVSETAALGMGLAVGEESEPEMLTRLAMAPIPLKVWVALAPVPAANGDWASSRMFTAPISSSRRLMVLQAVLTMESRAMAPTAKSPVERRFL